MRRWMAWIAGGLALVGGTFGTFAIVEAGMASASPSGACAAAQQRVTDAKGNLFFIEEFGAVLSLGGPYARAEVAHLIANAELQLNYAEQAAYRACTVITPTEVQTTTTTSSSSTSITSSQTSFTITTISDTPTV
jgi:hypothetical protein